MNRELFLCRLKAMLKAQNVAEYADILYDYEEHFRSGLEAGKTEEEIANELGDPEELAMTFAERDGAPSSPPPQKRSAPSSKALTVTGLILLDLFVAFPLAAALVSLWLGMFGVSLSLVAVSSGMMVNFLPPWFPYMPDLARIFMGIAFAGLTVLAVIGLWALVRSSSSVFKRYRAWHRKIISGGESA